MAQLRPPPSWSETEWTRQPQDPPARLAAPRSLAWRLVLLATLILTVSLLFLQALLFTTRGALPETAKKNTVRPFAVYLADGTSEKPGLQPRGIESIRKSLNQALLEQQVQIVDAYAGFSEQTLVQGNNSLALSLTGVSGASFASFRHLELVSGNFLMADAFNRRSIVLDELSAWQLFGATDIAGFTIKIQDKTFTVAGVVRLPDDWQSRLSRKERPQAFVLYETLNELDPQSSIIAYEVRLPEPVQGMGLQFLRDALGAGGIPLEQVELVDQDARLGLWPLLTGWRQVGQRMIRDSAVILPWWENAARAAVDLASLLALLVAFSLLTLAFGLYSLRPLPSPLQLKLLARLGLAGLAGLAAALFLIQTQGEWVPSGWRWLITILITLLIPQVIHLFIIGWSALRRAVPDHETLKSKVLQAGETLLSIIKQLQNRKSAKEETPI